MSQWTTSANFASTSGGSSSATSAATADKLANYTEATTDVALVNGDRVKFNSSGGALNPSLPAAPADGDFIKVVDTGNAGTNNITIDRNGKNINGVASDAVMNVDYMGLEFTYVSADNNWVMKVN